MSTETTTAETLREAAEEIRIDHEQIHVADEPTTEDAAWLAVADWLDEDASRAEAGIGDIEPAALAVARAYLGHE